MDQKNIIVGNKMRSIIVIDKKPSTKSGQKVVFTRKSNTSVKTIKRKTCGGCSRKRKN
jgi:predicted solute-binding protein